MKKEKKIAAGDQVSLFYIGKLEDGTIFDSTQNDIPLTFTVGSGTVLSHFESNILEMSENEKKNFEIKPEHAYGPLQENLIIEVPLGHLPPKINPHVGMLLKAPFKKLKQRYPVTIIGVSDISVTVDANHPLAGKSLFFEVKIIKIKKN